jgi:hypothetical protein
VVAPLYFKIDETLLNLTSSPESDDYSLRECSDTGFSLPELLSF